MDNVGTFHRFLHLASEVPRSNRDRTVPLAQNSGHIWEPHKKKNYREILQSKQDTVRHCSLREYESLSLIKITQALLTSVPPFVKGLDVKYRPVRPIEASNPKPYKKVGF